MNTSRKMITPCLLQKNQGNEFEQFIRKNKTFTFKSHNILLIKNYAHAGAHME
jgi:hypothetical protein